MNDPRRRLGDIVARCREASEVVARGRHAFGDDALLRHAAKSIIGDIGEAAKNLDDLATAIPGVPWTQIARTRDRVVHREFDVDYDVIWDTLTNGLPELGQAVLDLIENSDPEQ